MEFLIGVAQIFVCSVPIAVIGAWVSSRGATGMRGLVSPWRADPWPVGVQEEDPDVPWGHRPPSPPESPTELDPSAAATSGIEDLPEGTADPARPQVTRLHGSVHRLH